jgi:hypothetical protein
MRQHTEADGEEGRGAARTPVHMSNAKPTPSANSIREHTEADGEEGRGAARTPVHMSNAKPTPSANVHMRPTLCSKLHL